VPATPTFAPRDVLAASLTSRQSAFRRYLTHSASPAPLTLAEATLGPRSLLQEEMLAPFLRTPDLLHLSEAATWLELYRNQLGEIKMDRWCGYRSAAALTEQRRLHTIRLGWVPPRVAFVREMRALRVGYFLDTQDARA
jgi:hypothetical protein